MIFYAFVHLDSGYWTRSQNHATNDRACTESVHPNGLWWMEQGSFVLVANSRQANCLV